MSAADEYVRAELTSGSGRTSVGGVRFLDGVAYVPAASTLAVRVRSGRWTGVALTPADPEGLADYQARVAALEAPPEVTSSGCRPGVCGYGIGHACRRAFPDAFPPAPEQPEHEGMRL